MTVSRPAANTVMSNWQQRAQVYDKLGIPKQSYQQIAQNDITNVLNNGATPMSTAEVNAAMLAQMHGGTVVGNPTPQPKGILGDISSALSSVPSDVQGLLSGFIPGAVNFVHHLPSEITNTGALLQHIGDKQWLSQHGYDAGGGLGAGIRDVAKSPILNLIPGLADAADLTSAQGRQYLDTHPVSALLDVVPFAKPVAGLAEAGEAGGALEALQQGRVVRAGLRGARQGLSKLPVVGQHIPDEAFFQDVANKLGVSELYRSEVLRPHSTIGRKWSANLTGIIHEIGNEAWKMSPEERASLFAYNRDPNPEHYSPRNAELLQRLHTVQDKITQMGQERYEATRGKDGLLVIPHGKGKMIFAAKSDVAQLYRRADRLSSIKSMAERNVAAESHRIAKIEAQLRTEVQRSHFGPDRAHWKDTLDRIDKLRASLARHQADLLRNNRRVDQYSQLLEQTMDEHHDALMKAGGPAAVHPLVDSKAREAFRKIAQKRYEDAVARDRKLYGVRQPLRRGGRYNPEMYQQRQYHHLQQLQANLASIDNASRFEQIRRAIMGPTYKPKSLPDPNEGGLSDREVARRKANLKQDDKRVTQGNSRLEAAAQQLYDDTMKSVVTSVLDLVAHGYDPIWLKHVEPGEEEARALSIPFVHPLPDRLLNPSQYREKIFNFAPQAQDVALGLVSGAQELFRDQATREFLLPLIENFGKSRQELESDYLRTAASEKDAVESNGWSHHPSHQRTVAGHAQALMAQEWKEIDPAHYGLQHRDVARFGANDTIMIPKALSDNLESMMPRAPHSRLPLVSSAMDKSLKVFRFSVLTGPRHLVHVAVAGLLPLALREPRALLHMVGAWKLIHEGKAPVDLVKNLYTFQTDQIYNYAVGHQYGTWMSKAWQATGHKLERRLARLEESASDIYRVSAMLSAEARGVPHTEAMQLANKVAVDMDDMAPWERTIMKQVFPFYAFTRFLFRYLLSYPADHPLRISILSRFANQEQEEWNTLLPQKFMQMLWIGSPDPSGNILTIDYKNLNPFRSFSNDFTMVGFFQSLSPLLSAPFAARGFDTLTGVGSLYPQVEFNPQSGSLQAAPPSGRDQTMSVLEQFVPELGAVDHFLGVSDQMRTLKSSSPQAYRAMLFSQLNIPFAPVTVNKPYVEEHTEIQRYKDAQAAVTQAEKTNNWSQVDEFQRVPYQGQYVSPQQLEQYWNTLLTNMRKAGLAGMDPRAYLATPIHKTSPLPTEMLDGAALPPTHNNFGD